MAKTQEEREDKEFFRVFDFCENLEFFGADPEVKEAGTAKSLSARLFTARVDLVLALDRRHAASGFGEARQTAFDAGDKGEAPPSEDDIKADALTVLRETVARLDLENFVVRRHRRTVEKYQAADAWTSIDDDKREELVDEIAPLRSDNNLGIEEAKRFDLLMFSLELALLKGSRRFDALKKQLREIASGLEEQTGIPAIAQRAELIEEIQTDHWWEGITVPILELVRLRLRDLVQHIRKERRSLLFSTFDDEIGEGTEQDLSGKFGKAEFLNFKKRARSFLKEHEDHIVLHKLRHGKPLTQTDLAELEKMLLDAGVGMPEDIERARSTSAGLGLFVRSLIGLDRAAVSAAFAEFLSAGTASATQITFVELIIEHLTHQGAMDEGLLYEAPFIDIAPTGPEPIFGNERSARIRQTIRLLNDSAVA